MVGFVNWPVATMLSEIEWIFEGKTNNQLATKDVAA
jgi:hypothetical protein